MEVFLNDQELEIDNDSKLSKIELLHKVRQELDNEIIDKIYLGDVEINLKYFKTNDIKVSELDNIRFITKKTGKLIEETLLEAQDYLPRLKEGLLDTAALFREGELVEANNKLRLCLDGIEWYTGIINNIINLINEEENNETIKTKLKEFNNTISQAMIALQNDNYSYLADLLEIKVIEFIDEFIVVNKNMLKEEYDLTK